MVVKFAHHDPGLIDHRLRVADDPANVGQRRAHGGQYVLVGTFVLLFGGHGALLSKQAGAHLSLSHRRLGHSHAGDAASLHAIAKRYNECRRTTVGDRACVFSDGNCIPGDSSGTMPRATVIHRSKLRLLKSESVEMASAPSRTALRC